MQFKEIGLREVVIEQHNISMQTLVTYKKLVLHTYIYWLKAFSGMNNEHHDSISRTEYKG